MAKIPFTLDAWLKDKSQKVETRDGRTARIICTDAKADDGACIIALIPGYGGEEAYQFFPDGRAFSSKSSDEDCADLFLITPEKELTDFEEVVSEFAREVTGYTFQEVAGLRNCARWLMIAAREQLIQDGYVIQKKAFHDAVEKVDPEVMKEVSEKVDKANGLTEFEQELKSTVNVYVEKGWHMEDWDAKEDAKELLALARKELQPEIDAEIEKAYKNADEVVYRSGKEEALKDLPRWRYKKGETGPILHDCIVLNKYGCIGKSPSGALLGDVWMLEYDELAKLPKENPGFKEDSHY